MPAAIATGLPLNVPACKPARAARAIHDVRPGRRKRRPAIRRRRLRRTGYILLDAEPLLRAAGASRKPVITSSKISSAPFFLCDFAQKFQVARFGQIQSRIARHRLDDDASDFIFVRCERSLDRRNIVERQNNGVLGERGGHPGAVGMTERERAAAGFHQQ